MRILIMDDRPLGARKLRDDILTAEPDYQVEMAVTGGATSAAECAIKFVSETRERFDVFLIDDNMGTGPSGTELMTELRQLSPSSEAIIFTAYGDEAGKQRAIEAGARAYITRPFNERELLWQLHGVQRDQETRRERDWLHLLAATTRELQAANTLQDAGQAIVKGAQQLGFQRARLRMVCEGQGEQIELVGISQLGTIGLSDDYQTIRRSLSDLPYSRKVLLETRKPTLFHARELGEVPWDEFIGAPKDDWFKVPLFFGDTPIGTLSLDNNAEPIRYTGDDRRQLEQLLDLFGKQAAAALERARRQEQAKRQARTQTLLNKVSFAVTEQAAQGDLKTLLDALRSQIREHLRLDADSFAVALLDQGETTSHYLDFCYEYREGKTQPGRHWCNLLDDRSTAWIAGMIKDGQPAQDPASHQIGIPLRVQEEVIGIVLIQDQQVNLAIDQTLGDQLAAIAAHVAGLIYAVYREECEKERRKRNELREKLIERLRQLARTDENHFWHAILTFASHRDGYGFNRAVLFRYGAEGLVAQGRMGIGHFDRLSWQRDVAVDGAAGEGRSFAVYLALSSVGHLHITPLAGTALNWRLQLDDDALGPFRRVYTLGIHQRLTAAELEACLPEMQPWSRCALVPWKDGEKVLGVLLVDNAMDGKPIWPESIEALEMLLMQATELLNDAGERTRLQRQGESYESILELEQQLMAQAANMDLKQLLTLACQKALAINKADYVLLFPLRLDGTDFDEQIIVAEGALYDKKAIIKNRPREQGVASYVMRQGTLAVNNVMDSQLEFNGSLLRKQRYIEREKVAAFIGVPLRLAGSTHTLGVLYFDYRQPQAFSASDILEAEHLASVASRLISDAYRVEQEVEKFQRELVLMQDIHKESLAADTSEEKVISVVLSKAQELCDHRTVPILMVKGWVPERNQDTFREETRYFTWNSLMNDSEEIHPPVVTRRQMATAFVKGTTIQDSDTLTVPIRTSDRIMGCIYIDNNAPDLQLSMHRLANACSTALDNVRRQEQMRATLSAVQQVVTPTALHETLEVVIRVARRASPDLDCVTLWYRDPSSGKHMLGTHWGLLPGSQDMQNPAGRATQEQHELVDLVMGSQNPIWVHDTLAPKTNPEWQLARSDFVMRQKIVSSVAFPLQVKNRGIGALFFNYRELHRFTPNERYTLNIFAATAAAVIYDAQLLEQARQGEERLDAALKVVAAVGTELSLDTVLQQVLVELKKHFDKPGEEAQPYVMLYDEDEDVLYLPSVTKAFAPVDDPLYTDQLRIRLDDKGIVCRVARQSRNQSGIHVENIADVRSDPEFLPFNSRIHSLLCAGLTTKGRLWGVLAVNSPECGAFDEQDSLLLELAAQQALIAMERAEQAARLRFKDAVSSVTTWAAEMAHDVNREIGIIRNRAYWLRDEAGLSEQGRQWVQEIDSGAARLVDVTRSVRMDQRMDVQRFDLCQMLSRRIKDLVSQRWSGVEVVTEFHLPEVWLHSYGERLWRGVRHLVRNAAEAMKGNGTLIIRTKAHGDRIEVQIEDTGPGVPAELRSILFEQPCTSKGVLQEHGYGLLIARQLIESLGGQIRLLPQERGEGANFALTLPLTPERLS